MRHAIAAVAIAALTILAVAAPAAAQVLPPQYAGRVFLPIAANRRPLGEYGERAQYGWRTTASIIDVLRWDGLEFTVETYRLSHYDHFETVLVDRSGVRIYLWQDAFAAPEIRSSTGAGGTQIVFVENVGVSTFSGARDPFRRYADALIAECAASSDCRPERTEWRGTAP